MKPFIIFVALAICAVKAENDTCYADFLTSKNLIDRQYGSGQVPSDACIKRVEMTKENIIKRIKSVISANPVMMNNTECIVKNIDKDDYSNNLMMIRVYNISDKLTDVERGPKLNDMVEKLTLNLYNSFIICDANRKFGRMFDAIYSGTVPKLDLKEDYCIRKKIIDDKLIDSNKFQLNPNPKNINTADTKCPDLIEAYTKNAEEDLVELLIDDSSNGNLKTRQLAQDETDTILTEEYLGKNPAPETKPSAEERACVLKIVHDEGYIGKMLHFDYIKELSPNAEQRDDFRKQFVDTMKNATVSIKKCFL